ncbi:MAG: heme A synthase [Microlunatus sp.]|nr:heme A synthase [Microlunatus sp.]
MGRLKLSLRWMAVVSLIVNIVIIVTGGLVRLTDSGLGCSTWPQCTPGSYTPHAALGIHGAIEFGNRMITFILIIVAVLTFVAALTNRTGDRHHDRSVTWISFAIGLGIPFQGVIGGITVLSHLNPYVVALHMLDSLVLVVLAVWLVRLTWPAPPRPVGRRARALTVIAFGLTWVVVSLGTIVTGSGPHAGSAGARRTGLDPAEISHLHSFSVYLLIVATIGCLVLIRNRAALLLLLVEVAQGVIGFVQYYTGLPMGVVILHMLGAAATMALATNLLCSVRLTAGSEPVSHRPASAGHPTLERPVPSGSQPMPRS